jgi:hypothetical protein
MNKMLLPGSFLALLAGCVNLQFASLSAVDLNALSKEENIRDRIATLPVLINVSVKRYAKRYAISRL